MIRTALVSLLAVSAFACSQPAADNAASSSAAYSDFTLLATDTFACTLSSGTSSTTATLTRTLSQSKTDASARTFVQALHVGEPVFTAALKKFGPYGCQHDANEGLDYNTFDSKYGPATLPTDVSYDYSEGLQWANCDYEGTEAASIADTVSGDDLTVTLTRDNTKVTFTGTCIAQK